MAYVRIFFLFKAEEYFIVCIDHILLIPLSIDGHLHSTSWLLWIVLWTWVCRYFFETLLSTLSGIYPKVALLDHMVVKVFYPHTVFHSIGTILHSHQQSTKVPISLYPCQQLLFPVFFFLSFRNSLYILDINHISDTWFANIFQNHPVDCLFILSIVSFDAQNFKFSSSPICLFFSFVACAFDVISKKLLPSPMLWSFFPHILLKVLLFHLLCLGLWSSFSFCICCQARVQLCSLACGYPVEKTVLSSLSVLGILVETHLTIFVRVYFWILYSISLVYMSVFMLVPHWFDYYSFVIFWNPDVWILQLCSSFWLFSSLAIPYELQNEFFYFCNNKNKNAIGILTGVALNLQITLGGMDVWAILSLSVHKHGVSFHLFVFSLISFSNVLYFSVYKSFTSLVRFYF